MICIQVFLTDEINCYEQAVGWTTKEQWFDPAEARGFSHVRNVHTSRGVHPASCSVGIEDKSASACSLSLISFQFCGQEGVLLYVHTYDFITYTGMTSRFAANSHVAYWEATKLAGRQHSSVCCLSGTCQSASYRVPFTPFVFRLQRMGKIASR